MAELTADEILQSQQDPSELDKKKKKDNTKIWLYAGGGVLALVAVYFIFVKPTQIQEIDLEEEDYDLLNGNTPAGAAVLLGNDTTPLFFTSGSTMTVQDYVTLGERINAKWADRMDAIATAMDASIPVLGAGLGYMLAQEPGTVTEKGIDIWLRLVEQYAIMHNNAVTACASAISDVAVATIDGITKSTTCAQWTFVKDIKETKDYNVTTDIKVSETGKASSAVWGMFGSKKSSKTVTTHVEEFTHEERIIKFIPYCTMEVLDPTKLDALLAIQNISVVAIFSTMRNVTKQYPDPKLFFKQ